ncbi:hypothetical protein ACIBO2_33150 [Nonomuraea sp. NPDC050022]
MIEIMMGLSGTGRSVVHPSGPAGEAAAMFTADLVTASAAC